MKGIATAIFVLIVFTSTACNRTIRREVSYSTIPSKMLAEKLTVKYYKQDTSDLKKEGVIDRKTLFFPQKINIQPVNTRKGPFHYDATQRGITIDLW